MFRRKLLGVATTALGFVTMASATPQSTDVAAPAAQASTAAPATTRHLPVKPGDRNCVRDTGSLIPARKGECLPVSGRSYSKQDLDGTGERTLGPALEKLDPSVTVHGNGH